MISEYNDLIISVPLPLHLFGDATSRVQPDIGTRTDALVARAGIRRH